MNEKLQFLSEKDPRLGKLIQIIGELNIQKRPDYYVSLVRSIIGQQLSVTASRKIYERLTKLTNGNTTPETILSLPDQAIREIGVSFRKISYMKDLSKKVLEKEIDLSSIDQLENEEVISLLTSVKGIGEWTAQMFLIFTLERENVLTILDVGLHRGAKWLYGGENGKEVLIKKAKNWSPYETIASLYLWEVVNSGTILQYRTFEEYEAHMNLNGRTKKKPFFKEMTERNVK